MRWLKKQVYYIILYIGFRYKLKLDKDKAHLLTEAVVKKILEIEYEK